MRKGLNDLMIPEDDGDIAQLAALIADYADAEVEDVTHVGEGVFTIEGIDNRAYKVLNGFPQEIDTSDD